MARKKKKLPNGDAKKKPPKDTIWVVLINAAVFLTLATIALVLASLWGLGKYCAPPPSLVSVCETTSRKHRFWQKKEPLLPAPETPSQFCQTAWALTKRLPFVTWKVIPREEPQECREEKKSNPLLQKLRSFIFPKRERTSPATELASAFTKETTLSNSQARIMKKLFTRFRDHTPHFQERAAAVAWGGPGGSHWYTPNLVAANLRIMRWPEDLQTNFPFKLCQKGCSSEVALSHTLEWREKYKPWLMSPCSISENKDGFVYVHGHGRSLSRDVHLGHAMVWIRAGLKTNGVTDPECYFRAILNSLDQAVHVTLHRSHNQVGKFNVVIDAAHVSFHVLPNLGDTKKAIVMLQDHFPDRLGMVILANLGKGPEFLLNMIKPLITKEVRDKILVLPHDAAKRHKVLEAIVEHEFIPDYLGGTDAFQFNAKEYYPHKRLQWTDAEAKEYLQTMPYHA